MDKTINLQEYQHYRNFWQNNLQKIEEITELIEKSLSKLEKKYADFESIYDEISDRIDILSSIYSHYNSLLGREYLLKLRAVMRDYRKRYTHEGINFNLIYYIYTKIIELRNKSFKEFPKLKHQQSHSSPRHRSMDTAEVFPYKWITFQKNGTYFITPFDEVTTIDIDQVQEIYTDEGGRMHIKVDAVESAVIDPLSMSFKGKEKPNHFLIVQRNNRVNCFAAWRIGKRILARVDLLSPRLKSIEKNTGFRGSLRLFGENHLYIAI